MNRPSAHRFPVLLGMVALLAAPALAGAEDFTAKVKTSDLNLQTEAGVKTALDRVHRAALGACSDTVVGTRIARPDADCVAKVSAELVKRLNAPMVQAAFDASKSARSQS